MIFLTTNTAINVFLEEEFQNFGPEATLFGEEFGLTTFRLPDFDELMALDTSQACKGIRYDVVRNLFNFGIKTPEDFKNYTKEDILSIKGIGKMTLQRLKDNGVIFRR
ncbi:helix-hairpin-helix domain-containing protein [Streptococcus sobrinus]|uniref:helix-hairpin-helix domain-containing protein n=1 Tax=Streptococcus sobrinus TaxID=1310 RepID=UPI0002ED4812|nr:helix-hairpin-helix domain-containing protein [Streptococcus sobrinus]